MAALVAAGWGNAQTISIEEYSPRSTLVVQENVVTRAKFPLVDVNNQLRPDMALNQLQQLVKNMDALNLRLMVNTRGGTGARLRQNVENLKAHYPDRFVTFCNLDTSAVNDPDWSRRAVEQLREDVRNGAQGLKIFRDLGLTLRDAKGERIKLDDPRFDPVWDECGRLKIPVLLQTGDAAAMFEPADRNNERLLELRQFPARARTTDRFPAWETLMGEQHRVIEKHPGTVFIVAHLGWLGPNLAELGRLMDQMPNLHADIAGAASELGRQPRNARRWFFRYQNRVLFGKDIWEPDEYFTYFRILETADEYFDYYIRRRVNWKMYGLDLPDMVLKKLYHGNAVRLVPGIDPKLFEP